MYNVSLSSAINTIGKVNDLVERLQLRRSEEDPLPYEDVDLIIQILVSYVDSIMKARVNLAVAPVPEPDVENSYEF